MKLSIIDWVVSSGNMQIAWNSNMFEHGGKFCCCCRCRRRPRSINSQLIFEYITVSLTIHTYSNKKKKTISAIVYAILI